MKKEIIPFGEKLVYVEDGVAYTLNILDVPLKLADGKTVGLRQAIGMGVIRLEKLQYREIDENFGLVEVTTDFDPAKDAKVKDIMRPDAWALVDADGYPLKSQPSNAGDLKARYAYVRPSKQLDANSTGYHGSVAHGVIIGVNERYVIANIYWSSDSGVELVERPIRFDPDTKTNYREPAHRLEPTPNPCELDPSKQKPGSVKEYLARVIDKLSDLF